MLALPNHRRQLYSQSIIRSPTSASTASTATATTSIPTSTSTTIASATPPAAATPAPLISTPQPQYHSTTSSTIYSFEEFLSAQSRPLMQSERPHNSWLENGQLTPRSATRAHHRESSLSSLGSAGPSSPYTANTSNPQVVGDLYHEFQDYQHNSSKPPTPAHTPSQEHFLTPNYSNYYHNPNIAFAMSHDGLPPKQTGNSELIAAPEPNHSGRPLISSTVANDSPSTPPSYEDDRQKSAYRSTVPKLNRTMTDAYDDELYNPNFQLTSAPSSTLAPNVTLSPQNDVFSQRLQAANSQHLSANNIQAPLTIPSRERSPFRQGSPLAPTGQNFGGPQSPNVRFGTVQHLRQQQKAESDARALRQQLERASSEHSTPKTISPKDVDLVYHDNEEDANAPLFPPQQNQRQPSTYRQQPALVQDPSEDDTAYQRSYGSMATMGRESSSAHSTSSQATQQQGAFNFVPLAVAGSARQIPQQYPFVPNSRRQASNLSNASEDFPSTLTSMESSSSEYAADTLDLKKPMGAAADTGTYTCTYHGCTLRFDTPAKLQRHKREGHRNSTSASAVIGGGDEGGMTSAAADAAAAAAAQRNSQAGPHKCERINPSTGKPCNTIFSRPYDLTRHEDTIHNARKLKVHCPLCTEEKTFSRNDALTRHLRVVHPEHADLSKSRRRAGGGLQD